MSDPRDTLAGVGSPRGTMPLHSPDDDDQAAVAEQAREILRSGGRLNLSDPRVHRVLARLILAGS
jgi:hypothetical protein